MLGVVGFAETHTACLTDASNGARFFTIFAILHSTFRDASHYRFSDIIVSWIHVNTVESCTTSPTTASASGLIRDVMQSLKSTLSWVRFQHASNDCTFRVRSLI